MLGTVRSTHVYSVIYHSTSSCIPVLHLQSCHTFHFAAEETEVEMTLVWEAAVISASGFDAATTDNRIFSLPAADWQFLICKIGTLQHIITKDPSFSKIP